VEPFRGLFLFFWCVILNNKESKERREGNEEGDEEKGKEERELVDDKIDERREKGS